MKRSINPLIFVVMCSITSCQEKEVTHPAQSGTSIIKGRYTIAGTDIPVPDIDVYLYNSGWPVGGYQLVDETVTDSNGYYELTIGKEFTYGKHASNFNHTGYLSSRPKGGVNKSNLYDNNGSTYVQDFEMIPPAWVNVTLRNTSGRRDFDILYAFTKNSKEEVELHKKDLTATNMLRVYGNIPDTIFLTFRNYKGNSEVEFERKAHVITVPGFMIQDTIIDF